MTPYYSDDAVTIYHGDCLDVLPWIPHVPDPLISGVGVVLTSPPYNLNAEGKTGGHHSHSRLDGGYDTYADAMPEAEYARWVGTVLLRCWNTLTDDGAIFLNHKPRIGGATVSLPLDLIPERFPPMPLRQIIIWDRGSGFCRNATHYVPTHEWIMLLAKPAFRLNTRSVDDVWRIPFETGGEHPAPFPLALATRAIGSTDAQLVLDPFMGSGTTLRAAKDLGRKAIGIEISERYCEIAAKRMGQEVLDFG